MDISFDRISGLIDLLARMERFSLDSPGGEYLAIRSDFEKVCDAICEVLDSMDYEDDGNPADAVVQRIYGTPAYLSYHAAAMELFGRPFFDGVEHVKRCRRYKQEEKRYRGL